MGDPLVEDWIRYHVERRETTDPLFAACDKVHEIVHNDPETGWTLTLALIETAPDDWVLANVAAGPLEDLLCRSPDRFLDRAEIQHRRDDKFHRCITGVWGLPDDFIDRLDQYTSTVEKPR